MLRELRRLFRLVLVDNRGSGRSDVLAGSFGVADVVAALHGALLAGRIPDAQLVIFPELARSIEVPRRGH